MKYNFNKIIDRTNTHSIKHGAVKDGTIPLWVADMDFKCAPEILRALKKRVKHGVFGYTATSDRYYNAVADWFFRHFDWHTQKEWLVKTPGVVFALAMFIRALTSENQSVLIQQPVYYPFESTVLGNNRKLVVNELVYENNRYTIDFESFEKQIADNDVKLFILCSPHNPVGRVWTAAELCKMAEICQKHGVFIVSDEIHADFTFTGFKHSVLPVAAPFILNNCAVCTSPSKSFNLAGLQVSNIFIADEKIRKLFIAEIKKSGLSLINTLGLEACYAAYTKGEKWLFELKDYLEQNLDFIRAFLERFLPKIKLVEPEGTYLVWLDCSRLELDKLQLSKFFKDSGVILNDGHTFGKGGECFMRMNIASPLKTIKAALLKILWNYKKL